MFNNLFKKEAPKEQKREITSVNSKPQDYYGRFSLEDVDRCIDDIQLNRWQSEVQLDFDNNKVRFEETQLIRYKKHMNFCKFFMHRIRERQTEIDKIEAANNRLLTRLTKTPEKKWKAIIDHIIELNPGINLQEILFKIGE